MLALLLDQQISPTVAEQIRARRPEIPVLSLYEWRGGACVGQADALILQAAAEEGLTLVTYDLKTIPPILKQWPFFGISHGGVVFVDNHTIATNDFGRLVRGLAAFWDRGQGADWTDRIGFLPAPLEY